MTQPPSHTQPTNLNSISPVKWLTLTSPLTPSTMMLRASPIVAPISATRTPGLPLASRNTRVGEHAEEVRRLRLRPVARRPFLQLRRGSGDQGQFLRFTR